MLQASEQQCAGASAADSGQHRDGRRHADPGHHRLRRAHLPAAPAEDRAEEEHQEGGLLDHLQHHCRHQGADPGGHRCRCAFALRLHSPCVTLWSQQTGAHAQPQALHCSFSYAASDTGHCRSGRPRADISWQGASTLQGCAT